MKILMAMMALILVGSSALADEQFQMGSAPGVWKAEDNSGVFNEFDLYIVAGEDGASVNIQHCTPEIETTGTCTAFDQAEGVGEYSPAKDYIQVHETNSHTWKYTITIDPKNPNLMFRVFGTQIIRYFKVK
jgi:hypothetical protein